MLKMLAGDGCCGHLSLSILWLHGTTALELFCFVPRCSETLECAAPQTLRTCPGIPWPLCCSHLWLSLSGWSWKLFLPFVSLAPVSRVSCGVSETQCFYWDGGISVDLVALEGLRWSL